MHRLWLLALVSSMASAAALVGGGGAKSARSYRNAMRSSTRSYLTMQQHSGGARQRHRMRDKEMERIERQREPTGGVVPKLEARRAASSARKLKSSNSAVSNSRKRARLPGKQSDTPRPAGLASRGWPVEWRRTGDVEVPVDVVAVEALLEEREQARARQDYALADKVREELWRNGISVFDNERTWTVVKRAAP